jgi:hypothetical protein
MTQLGGPRTRLNQALVSLQPDLYLQPRPQAFSSPVATTKIIGSLRAFAGRRSKLLGIVARSNRNRRKAAKRRRHTPHKFANHNDRRPARSLGALQARSFLAVVGSHRVLRRSLARRVRAKCHPMTGLIGAPAKGANLETGAPPPRCGGPDRERPPPTLSRLGRQRLTSCNFCRNFCRWLIREFRAVSD